MALKSDVRMPILGVMAWRYNLDEMDPLVLVVRGTCNPSRCKDERCEEFGEIGRIT